VLVGAAQVAAAILVVATAVLLRHRALLLAGLLSAAALGVGVGVQWWVEAVRRDGRRTAAAERAQLDTRFQALVENARELIVVVELNGHVSYASPSAAHLLDIGPQAQRNDLYGLVVEADREELARSVERLLSGESPQVRLTARFRRRDGGEVWLDTVVTDRRHDPAVAGLVLNAHDITDGRRLEDQLRHQAFHDQLTGLANRALFQDRLAHRLARGGEGPGGPALLYLDLDAFKALNDSRGHAGGDAVLRDVASRLTAAVREQDTVARLGGDEFAVLLDDTLTGWEGEDVAARLISALGTPDGGCRVSVGIVPVDGPNVAPTDLLRDAATAMYAAKAAGGQRATLFDPVMRVALARRSRIRLDLANAAANGELVLHYQPTVDLRTGRVRGVEALVRWNHPTLGLLPPNEFIGLAEETGDIVGLGRWVLTEACVQRRRWQLEQSVPTRMTIAVNVSARQLEADVLVDDVRSALEAAVLDPALLVVEITESQLLDDREGVDQLGRLREMGVAIAVDDFGTGYSSLSYLQNLPVDILKIDRSFVQAMTGSPDSMRLVESIIAMAGALGLDIVAEGVEELEQLAALRDLACPVGQGYLWARPLLPDALTARLTELAADETTRRPARRSLPGAARPAAAVVPPLS